VWQFAYQEVIANTNLLCCDVAYVDGSAKGKRWKKMEEDVELFK
jgi:hypothetical protein